MPITPCMSLVRSVLMLGIGRVPGAGTTVREKETFMKTITLVTISTLTLLFATCSQLAKGQAVGMDGERRQPLQQDGTAPADPGRVQALASARFPDTFGGLYIEHRPRYRVVVNFSRDAKASLRQLTADETFEAVTVTHSLRDLDRIGETVKQVLREKGLDCTLSTDPTRPSLKVWMRDQDLAPARAALAEAGLAQPFVVVTAYEIVEPTGGRER